MYTNILTFIIFLSTTSLVYAENHMIIIGGGGEPMNESTIFDSGMMKLGRNLESIKWKYEVSFNGGHRNTEKILQKQFNNGIRPVTNFTEDNFNKMLEDYRKKILNNEIKANDQLMILINTHGAQRNSGESTHSIALSGGVATDLNNLSGAKSFSLDKLQEIIKLTNERGIKLGIVDLSCHSGTTLSLKKNAPNTCIVSASGPNHYGFVGIGSFTENFLSRIKTGVSLEEVFLDARRQSYHNDYPMISTSQNDKIIKDVYAGITPFLYYYDPSSDKLTPYILENNSQTQLCKRENDFKKLISQIDALNSILISEKNTFNTDKIKGLLLKYKKTQDEILNSANEKGTYKLQNIETFPIPLNAREHLLSSEIKYSWAELMDLDVDNRITQFESFKQKANSKQDKDNNQYVINFLLNVKIKKEQIVKDNPFLLANKKHTALTIKNINNSYKIVNDIAHQEKILYQELYDRSQKINKEDPCKKFIF